MTKEEQAHDAEPTTRHSSKETHEPIQPLELIKCASASLREVPWVGLGTVGTGLGLALLYSYFSSIGFVPADIPSTLSAGLLVTMQAVAFIAAVVLGLTAPLAAYRAMGLELWPTEDQGTNSVAVSGLWALQLVGAGGLILYIGIALHRDCAPSAGYFIALSLALLLLGCVGWVLHEKKTAARRSAWPGRLLYASLVCVMATLPLLVLWQLLVANREPDWWHFSAFLLFWLLVVGGTSLLQKIPLWACVLVVAAMSPILLFSVPSFLGFPAFLPSKVAEVTGIRGKTVDELRVPHSTCALIQSALGSGRTSQPLVCTEGDWGTVHAQVLSNLGDRWWVELKLAGTAHGSAIRLTIPGEGVQTVRRIDTPPPRGKACT